MQSSRYEVNLRSQYRSAIFCSDEEQFAEAKASRDLLEKELVDRGLTGMRVSTQIEMVPTFWPAEEYHQQYYAKRMGAVKTCRVL